jgi:hypothetical protein
MITRYKDLRQNIEGIGTGDIFFAKFKNAGSDDMTIDGSVTPVEFTLEDLPETDFLLQRVTFLIGADSIVELDQFGGIAALANGVLFAANQDTVEVKAEATIQTNGDAILISSNVELEAIAFAAVQASAVYGTWDFTETYNDHAPIILNKDLKIVIRDNLTGVSYFKVSCHGILLSPSDV